MRYSPRGYAYPSFREYQERRQRQDIRAAVGAIDGVVDAVGRMFAAVDRRLAALEQRHDHRKRYHR